MATWLMLVIAALVLAVLGATTAATWLVGVAVLLLAVGAFFAVTGRSARSADRARGGER